MIEFQEVSKIYTHDSIALDNVSFHIKPKEFVSIIGASGAGKTTLLKLLMAEEKPSSGNVFFESADVHALSLGDLYKIRRKMGAIFQDFKLLPTKTVFENIAFILEIADHHTDKEIEADTFQILELVGLGNKTSYFPSDLSAGERQRVAIARAIVNHPDVILADEPTGNLDPLNTKDIVDLLIKINEMGTTVILTTHNKDIVNSLQKRVITLEKGKIVRDNHTGAYLI
ncbi:MAG: cell division ATP-binding protein FtsE [Candidatus Niyogibacteria bacterium RIFCSPLOWO2_12_FULL_41_13]|uniref:Cell division ATP-binding protein FtsE n=1 Tax=Candidatus Niyogibacteria bacterium RIFCSPLOWO2_12_FULL_41_13 TaxID=1801726 RepID=A0A1G2F2L8_9BACT|nr:MAG: cell division ATP-binding protein FtsE [Candidatus Niyogibacteria bacterium RIFCSPLOWO2_12_FULL_41_13]